MESNIVRCPDPKVADAMIARINDVRKVVEVYIASFMILYARINVPCGLHLLIFDRSLLPHDGRTVIPLEVLLSAL